MSLRWTHAWTRWLAGVQREARCERSVQFRPLLTGTSLFPEATSSCQRGVAFGVEPSCALPHFSAHWWRGQLWWWQPSWRRELFEMRRWRRSQGRALAPCSQGRYSSPWRQSSGRSSKAEWKWFKGGFHQSPAFQLPVCSYTKNRYAHKWDSIPYLWQKKENDQSLMPKC